jgi:hypothetical protein
LADPDGRVDTSVYALRALLKALGPVIGAELQSGGRIQEGWAEDIPADTIKEWEAEAHKLRDEMDTLIQDTTTAEYRRLMNRVR